MDAFVVQTKFLITSNIDSKREQKVFTRARGTQTEEEQRKNVSEKRYCIVQPQVMVLMMEMKQQPQLAQRAPCSGTPTPTQPDMPCV